MKQNDDEVKGALAHDGPSQTLCRRKFLKASMTGAVIVGAGALASCMMSPSGKRGAGTTPKLVAHYQSSPNQGRRCADCIHFLEPNACEIVAGEISPDGWCRFYKPRSA
jgi:hypothetical protein